MLIFPKARNKIWWEQSDWKFYQKYISSRSLIAENFRSEGPTEVKDHSLLGAGVAESIINSSNFELNFFQCFICPVVAHEILHRVVYDSFCSDSPNPWRIIFIFELDLDIDRITLWVKILSQSDDFWKSYRVNGPMDTDQFYSVLTFWIHNKHIVNILLVKRNRSKKELIFIQSYRKITNERTYLGVQAF